MNFNTWIKDTAERAGSTLVQSLITYLLAAQVVDWGNWKAIVAAVFPAVFSVIKNAMLAWAPQPKTLWLDIVVRTGWTFVLSVLGLVSADAMDLFDVTAWRMVVIGASTAALAVLKSSIAKNYTIGGGESITPASLAPRY